MARLYPIEDLSAGVYYEKPDPQIPENGVRDALNFYWDKGALKVIGGTWLGGTCSSPALSSVVSCFWYAAEYGIAAAEAGSGNKFYLVQQPADPYIDNSYTLTVISGTPTLSGGTVEFTRFSDDIIIALDTSDNIVYVLDKSSGTWSCSTLDVYDTRTRTNVQWFAGVYDDAGGTTWTDDTTDAQDAGAADFDLCLGTANYDGFYIAGVVTFNKVVAKSVSGAMGPAVYEYYDGSAWQDLDMVTTPGWAGAGDQTMEWNPPTDWAPWDGADPSGGATGSMAGRFVMRVRFNPGVTNRTCDYFEISHTKRFTEILGGESPTHVAAHNNRLYVSAANAVHYSPYAQLTEWTDYEVEYCLEGGDGINAMKSFKGFLAVFKDNSIHGIFGSSYDDLRVEKLEDVGSKSPALGIPIVDENRLLFIDVIGNIRVFDGETSIIISSPVENKIRELLANSPPSATHICYYAFERVWTNWGGGLVFDPDSVRRDSHGGDETWVASFWRHDHLGFVLQLPVIDYEKYQTQWMLWFNSGYFYIWTQRSMGINNASTAQNGTFTCYLETKGIDCKRPQLRKVFKRLKMRLRFAPELAVTLTTDEDDTNKQTTINVASFYYVVADTISGQSVLANISSTDISKMTVGDAVARSADLNIDPPALQTFFYTGTPLASVDTVGGTATFKGTTDGYKAATGSVTSFTFWFYVKKVKWEKSIPYNQDGYRMRIKLEYNEKASNKSWGVPGTTQSLMAPFEIQGLYIEYEPRSF